MPYYFQISCSSPCVVAQFTMDAWFNAARTRTGGSMVTLTPLDQFSNEQIFQTSYLDSMYSIAVLVITVNQYPVEGLYINNQTLDVSIRTGSKFDQLSRPGDMLILRLSSLSLIPIRQVKMAITFLVGM